MSNPVFSIIVPSHNGIPHITKALESCKSQTYTDYELIVVADACDDNTEKVAQAYGAKTLAVDYHRDGLTRNAGLDIATGDYILFLDDDDWWLHEFVFQQLYDIIRDDPTADVVNFAVIWRHEGYRSKPPGKYLPMAAGHCWRRAFVADTRFNNAPYSSDLHFLHTLIEKRPVGLWSAMPMYYYNYMRPGSLSDQHRKGEI